MEGQVQNRFEVEVEVEIGVVVPELAGEGLLK